MKKLLLLLMIIPMIGFGQADQEYFKKGHDYLNDGKYELAIVNYTACININPNYQDAYLWRGAAFEGLGYYYVAIKDFTLAIEMDPRDEYTYQWRGQVKNKLEDYEGAISDFTLAIKVNPNFSSGYFHIAMAKKESGLPYCYDAEKACDLDNEPACIWYNRNCE